MEDQHPTNEFAGCVFAAALLYAGIVITLAAYGLYELAAWLVSL